MARIPPTREGISRRASGRPRLLALVFLTVGCGAPDGTAVHSTTGDRAIPPRGPPDALAPGGVGEASTAIPVGEYRARRARLLGELSDGILLVRARAGEKAMEQWGFVQDPTFLHLTGLAETPGAILALDGPAARALLFLPPPPRSFGLEVAGVVPEPGPGTADRLGLDAARPWEEFRGWIDDRLGAGVEILYVDGPRRPEATGAPPGLPPLAGDHTLWRAALARTFPAARIEDARSTLVASRAVKSEAEVELLARNARRTVTSLLAVAASLAPGVTQRESEGAMVAACLATGGQGPSFWPWTMSGANARVEHLVGAFFRYDQGNRPAEAGELVRVDIGCADGLYGADVGRTLPVSGHFSDGQAEAWDLLVEGYRAGLAAMADDVPVSQVRAASRAAIEERAPALRTAHGRSAAEAILSGGDGVWHIHGVGIESGEDIPDVLRTGMVVAYEPGFAVGGEAYYLEDMILVTEAGHEVLSAALPYTAAEIAEVMERARRDGNPSRP